MQNFCYFYPDLFRLLCDLLLCDERRRLLITPARWQGVYFPLNVRNLAL